MIKEFKHTETITVTEHEVYCDGCGEKLYDHVSTGDLETYNTDSVVIFEGSYYRLRKKHWCPDCYEKESERIINGLKSIGFEETGEEV